MVDRCRRGCRAVASFRMWVLGATADFGRCAIGEQGVARKDAKAAKVRFACEGVPAGFSWGSAASEASRSPDGRGARMVDRCRRDSRPLFLFECGCLGRPFFFGRCAIGEARRRAQRRKGRQVGFGCEGVPAIEESRRLV